MLEPQARLSIYDILRPPGGFELDCLVATTYSASLDTVLSLPAAMLVDSTDAAKQQARIFTANDLAALKRVCGRTAIFCQGAAIHPAELVPPAIIEAEEMVHEVSAPNGGSFHPKVWLIRFKHSDAKRSLLRVAIMSRNLTGDASWDAGVVLDSKSGAGAPKANDLGMLLRLLPTWCIRPLDQARRELLLELASEVEVAKWKMPAGVGTPTFHAVGNRPGRAWIQPESKRLAIISPFLTASAIKDLAKSADALSLIVSRPDALERCWETVSDRSERQMVLAPPGEPTEGSRTKGLHAKLLIWESRSRIRLAIGSMNATSAAINGRNVEFMVSFDCTEAIGEGAIDALLERRSMGSVLEDFEPAKRSEPLPDPFDDRAARAYLLAAQLHLECSLAESGWELCLTPRAAHADIESLLPGLRFRPATLASIRSGPCGASLAAGEPAKLPGTLDLAEITGFIVFEADTPDGMIAFVRNLEVRGVEGDARRHAALKALLPDKGSFSDFLRVLLGDFRSLEAITTMNGANGEPTTWRPTGQSGILEMLIRCAADDPARLQSIEATLKAFRPEELETVTPPEFRELWSAILEMVSARR
ncbi:hypothetical protein IVB22_10925 [Bradyrhizobium sp. 190]|uniref:phospholipase D family protein n=1 Tax=Bradyrhizobium sp. 190 TaxID=2782658 RepID=UPI001FFC0F54|nr:phospholipase D family protein [Bradyrhizobium sp. 190]MCK1513074.1 hypothetical protein [Bradyrhizobium sp. 190]